MCVRAASTMPVLGLTLSSAGRDAGDPPRLNPGLLLQGVRAPPLEQEAGVRRGGAGCKGWAGAGLVQAAGEGRLAGWLGLAGAIWLVQVAGAGGWWCRWLAQVVSDG